MALPDDQFKMICEKLSRELYTYFKRKLVYEMDALSRENKKSIDENTTVNIILHSSAALSGNVMIICKNILNDINMDKLIKSHHILMEGVINDCIKHQKTN